MSRGHAGVVSSGRSGYSGGGKGRERVLVTYKGEGHNLRQGINKMCNKSCEPYNMRGGCLKHGNDTGKQRAVLLAKAREYFLAEEANDSGKRKVAVILAKGR